MNGMNWTFDKLETEQIFWRYNTFNLAFNCCCNHLYTLRILFFARRVKGYYSFIRSRCAGCLHKVMCTYEQKEGEVYAAHPLQ